MSTTPNNNSKQPQEKISRGLGDIFSGIRDFFHDLIDLKDGLDKEGTIINIRNNKRMNGANAWLLMCSIMIASLGLDLNSEAVIIGAMLISPLMAPILGVGMAVGINDYNGLYISLRHFMIAIGIALFTSTIYFLFTPFGDITPQISARTRPTLLDAMVALFGGIAGIISGSRKDKSNAIPGVAIATALMPPLCVTGFGIASLIRYGTAKKATFDILTDLNNWQIALNSFYLFFLNATLVALATFAIVRFLDFPSVQHQDKTSSQRANSIILIFCILVLVPSFFILRGVLRNINEENAVKAAVLKSFKKEMKYVDALESVHTDSTLDITIKVYAPLLSKSLDAYKDSIRRYIPNAQVELLPTSEINLKKFTSIETKVSTRIDSIVEAMNQPYIERNEEIVRLEKRIDMLTGDSLLERSVEREIMALYGDVIDSVKYYHIDSTDSPKSPMLSIAWKRVRDRRKIEERLRGFLSSKTGQQPQLSEMGK
ncbi:MAG: DUF389 domain-containing protein [Bacteroidota bacterium]